MTIPTIRRRLATLVVLSVAVIATLSLVRRQRLDQGESTIPSIPVLGGTRPIVTLRQGTYIGIEVKGESKTTEQFLGIPYALSTGGERRFRAPVPVGASSESYEASRHGNRCPGGPESSIPQDEDCLNANIFRPKVRPPGRKLPVLVHIYGGAFNFGSARDRNLANMVAWSIEPFIAVGFNYRVGALGFLPSKLTQREGLLNAGLKDQALLLQWVQDNIAEFGGDPKDVTLMGQSAGAHSIGHHVLRNRVEKPLFHKAILESGAATARACYTPTNKLHEQHFREFLAILGCEDVPEKEIIETLRTFTFQDIRHASEAVLNKYNPSVRWPWQPVIDGAGGIIPTRPIDSWKAGKWHKIPILTGFNTNEGSAFTPKQMATSDQFTEFFNTLLPGLSDDDLLILDQTYPDPLEDPSSKYVDTRIGLGAEFKRVEQAYGHFAYVAPVKLTVDFAAAASNKPVYLYHFAVNSSIVSGADHGTNSPYPTYNKDVRGGSHTLAMVARAMHAYWTSFITTGDPNAVKGRYTNRPEWPAYTRKRRKLIVFGENNDEFAGGGHAGTAVKVVDDDWAVEECKFWWERTEKFEI